MKRVNVSDIIYNKIIEEFKNDNIKFGECLVETKYAEKFQVSRTPLREAIKKLEQEGLIIRMQNGRLKMMEVDNNTIIEIFNIRIAIENMLLQQIIENHELLKEMENNINDCIKYLNTKNFLLAKSTVSQFSSILYKSLTLDLSIKMLSTYNILIDKLKNKTLAPEIRLSIAIDEHVQIFKALNEKNCSLAMQLNEEHILGARNSLLKNIRY